MHRLQELVRLHRLGTGARETARLLGMSPNTERRYRRRLEAAELLDGDASELPPVEALKTAVGPVVKGPQETSSVEAWRPTIERLLEQGAGPQAIYDHLRTTEEGFDAHLSSVKRLCRRVSDQAGPKPEDVAIPVETRPGHVGQVDFGYVGMLFDPEQRRLRKAYVFVLVLGFSRHMFARLVFDQTITTWQRLHAEAFAALGGVCEVVVPDNLKAAVVRAAFAVGDETVLNRSYCEVARAYGFKVDPTPPRAPQKKGKVESGVKYVKRNFIATLDDGADIHAANAQLDVWVERVAGLRVHGSTGKRPLHAFVDVEKAALLPLPPHPFEPVQWAEPKLGRDARFVFEGAVYSAPWRFIGQKVSVRGTPRDVRVFVDDERVATHPRMDPGGRSVREEHLPPGRRDLRHREPEHWLARARAIGDDVAVWADEVLLSDDVLSKVPVLQKSIPLLEAVSPSRACAACRRASFFGTYAHRAIHRILDKGLDEEPLTEALVHLDDDTLTHPRFARDIRELLQLPKEKTHAPH